jgi:PAS domain S-box-containing protein
VSDDTKRVVEDHRFKILVDAVVDYAIYMLDADGTVASWNAGAERAKGYRSEEILGRHFSLFYTAEDRSAGLPERALATAAESSRFEAEGWRVRKDGSRFWAHVVIDPIRAPDGALIGFAKVTRDMTERLNARRALDQAQAALSQAQKMEAVGKLTGGIAHDFNNLLTVIINSLDLVGRGVTDPKGQKRLQAAQAAAERAASLTQQLLAFARRQPLLASTQDISAIIGAIEPLLRRSCGDSIALVLALDSQPLTAYIDAAQFEVSLLNLIDNACDAMQAGGQLTIATSMTMVGDAQAERLNGFAPGPAIRVSVEDTGSGMPPEVVAQAFDPFFTTKEIGKGTGLGLSQVYGFVKQSHGHVDIDSEPGRRTRVTLYLPVAAARSDALPKERPMASRRAARRALIVEDEQAVLEVAIEVFRDLGFEVVTACSGDAGLEILRRDADIDVLFTDVVMPGKLNGLDLASEARALQPGLTIIVSSGYPLPAMTRQRDELGAFTYLPKPYRSDDLAQKLGLAGP